MHQSRIQAQPSAEGLGLTRLAESASINAIPACGQFMPHEQFHRFHYPCENIQGTQRRDEEKGCLRCDQFRFIDCF
jgi:hypothetical protein